MIPVIAERMMKRTIIYLPVGNSLLNNSKQAAPATKARIKPADNATLNKALSSIHFARLISSTTQKIKKPGAEKSNEMKEINRISTNQLLQ